MQATARGTFRRVVMTRHLPPNMVGDYSENGWQTEETFMRYIEQHLIPYFNGERVCLVLDRFSAQLTPAVRRLCRNGDIELEYVPARMTSTLQPLDIGVNRVIRRSAR